MEGETSLIPILIYQTICTQKPRTHRHDECQLHLIASDYDRIGSVVLTADHVMMEVNEIVVVGQFILS